MDYELESLALAKGYTIVCGVDEAGRGPLCGPVCAAAVILPQQCQIDGINDSKKLSEKKREQLYDVITEKAIAYCAVMVDAQTIDKINILNATLMAMQQAVSGLKVKPDIALIDGNRAPKLDIAQQLVVKGDAKSVSIAAASIIAKVTRDRYMLELDKKYPQYEFFRHKGYGTRLHYEKLEQYGPCPEHRKSFLKKFYQNKEE